MRKGAMMRAPTPDMASRPGVRFRPPGGLVLIGKAAVLKTAAQKCAYRFESCALRFRNCSDQRPATSHASVHAFDLLTVLLG